MNLQDLQPCAKCHGAINPLFYKVDVQSCMIDQGKLSRNLGLMHLLGGSPGLAETFSPDRCLEINLTKKTQFLLCQDCFLMALGVLHEHLEPSDELQEGIRL